MIFDELTEVNKDFSFLYDIGRPLRLIGNTTLNLRQLGFFRNLKDVEIVSLEDLIANGKEWSEKYQFFAGISDVSFKLKVLEETKKFNLHFISIVSNNSSLHPELKIGKGTYIGPYCNISGIDIEIGNHSYVTSGCCISEYSHIADYCYLSAYCYTKNCYIGDGCMLGARASIFKPYSPDRNEIIKIAPYSNFFINSNVTKDLDVSGTYYGNKLMEKATSLTKRIL
jgi:acetyltransferase-like isoleucine patch superfamily enzyme